MDNKKYIISDTLQSLIDWENIMKMERYAGGHDEQMKGLEHKTQIIELPNHVSDFDVAKYVMSNVNIVLNKVLNIVSNNIEAKITSNCKDAIHKALNKDER